MATLDSQAITEDGEGGAKNKDGRKRHPYRRPTVSAHLPRLTHTERNVTFGPSPPAFGIRFGVFGITTVRIFL